MQSMTPSETGKLFAEVADQVRRLRRQDFLALLDGGAFDDDEDVELLLGVVVVREQPSPEHETALARIGQRLMLQIGNRADVRVSLSLALSEYSLPRPDVFVAPVGDYWHEHPERAYLCVEVATTSLRKDRGLKRRLYGASPVDEYWLVNVVDCEVEVYRDRVDGEFRTRTVHHPGETLRLVAFPDVAIAVTDIVPPPQG
jgi:Uma2 family endonuclease